MIVKNEKIICLLFVLLASPTYAGLIAIDITSEGPGTFDGGFWTLGWSFTASSDLVVNSLGQWDYLGDGLETEAHIGIYDDSGTLLVSTVVSSGTAGTFLDGYRYASVADTLLLANQTYFVGSWFDGFVFRSDYSGYSYTSATGIENINPAWSGGNGTLKFPTSSSTGFIYAGPNFQYEDHVSIPEPSSLALLMLGLAGFRFSRKKKAV